MENVLTAVSLALVAKRFISIQTQSYARCSASLRRLFEKTFLEDDIVEIDLRECHGYKELTSRMIRTEEGQMPRFYSIILWRNLETLEMSLPVKRDLLAIFNQIERYGKLALRDSSADLPVQIGSYTVLIPEFFLILPVLQAEGKACVITRDLIDRFWFCQSYFQGFDADWPLGLDLGRISATRQLISGVYHSPQIVEYIFTLMVFTRSHRLCSLAPLLTRPSIRAREAILDLAVAMVAFLSREADETLFVTPDHVRIAYKKVCYWLVNWETNPVFCDRRPELEARRRMEIAMLTGDWYGSEWGCVEHYLDEHRAVPDHHSTTGFTNTIVDEVLELVLPPF